MRLSPLVLALVLLSPLPLAATTPGPAPLADAGATRVVELGQALPLDGFAEGFAGPVTASWSTAAPCVIADPAALATTATCSAGGVHAFTLAVTDGASTATDDVRHVVQATSTQPLLRANGTIVAGKVLVTAQGTHLPGPNSGPMPFTVAAGAQRVVATLTWTSPAPGLADDLDMTLTGPGNARVEGDSSAKPEVVTIAAPAAGDWNVTVVPFTADRVDWTLSVDAVRVEGADLPTLRIPGSAPSRDGLVRLYADLSGVPVTGIAWETDLASRRFDDGAAVNLTTPFTGATLVRARVTTADGLEVEVAAPVRARGDLARPLTVVAVIDGSFSPYHYDFLGAQHPWNRDADPANDIDFTEHPAAYVADLVDVTPVQITLPTSASANVDALRTVTDRTAWSWMERSTAAAPKAYWFPGTKVVAALKFSASFQDVNAAHGSASASVAAGNWRGTCPECVFVLISGSSDAALAWASAQPWIDVVTNSYGAGSVVQANTAGFTRDNAYWRSPVDATRAASEAGQVIVFSAGNGFLNAFDVPMLTYWSSQKGPDWMVTVGAVDPDAKQTYSGAGKPVDVSSIGSSYPASGGTTANGTGTHSGTSNAAPVTAGTFAKALQGAREALGDATPGHAGGVVAQGAPVACGAAVPACALGDGVLTRRELEAAVYASVLPSETGVAADTTWPTTPLAYYYQGHGVIVGRIDGQAAYDAEWQRIAAHLRGDAPAHARPAGEANWFLVDSKCRQHLWGAWSGGLYAGGPLALDPVADPLATSVDAWCSALPEKPFLTLGRNAP